ncbi:MAG: hypothetical protein JKY14_05360 [Paraglaciecola sp.]|nr:hypothetical protein [Paraglaciecola sp.]
MAGTSNSFIESKDLTASLNFRLHEWKLYIKEFFLIIFYLGYVTIFIRHLINSVLMLFTTKKVHLHEIDDVSFKDSDITFVKSILKISNALPTKNTIIESDVISRKGSIATQWAFTVIISLVLLIGHDLRSPSWGLMPFNLLDNVYMHEPLICIFIAVATFFVVTYIDILRKKTLLMLVTKRLYREQENRDKKAADIVESINTYDGDLVITFAVYLRPFESTGKLKSKKTGIEIETALGLVFPDYLPIISLGEPGEHIGTSRIKTDEEKWKTMGYNTTKSNVNHTTSFFKQRHTMGDKSHC